MSQDQLQSPLFAGDSRRTLRTLIDNLPGVVYRCLNDENWTAEVFSDGAADLTGYPAADFNSHRRHYTDVIHPSDRQRVWDDVQAAVAKQERFTLTYRIITAGGAVKWVWEQGCGIFTPGGTLEALEGFITDVTGKEAREAAIQENERQLETLFLAVPVATWEEDFSAVRGKLAGSGLTGLPEGAVRQWLEAHPAFVRECIEAVRILRVNEEAVRLHRARDRGELLEGLGRLLGEEARHPVIEQLVAIATGRTFLELECKVRTLDGEVRDVLVRWSVAPESETSFQRVLLTTMDITARKRVQEEADLLHSITRGIAEAEDEDGALRLFLRHVCDVSGWALGQVWVPDPGQGQLRCHRAWHAAVSGLEEFRRVSEDQLFSPGEGLPGSTWSSGQVQWIDDVGHAANFPRQLAAARAGLRAAVGVPILVRGEAVLVVEFFLRGVRARDQHLVAVIAAIAAQIGLLIERKRASSGLAREQALLAATIKSLPGVFYLFDEAGRFLQWNGNLESMTGYSGPQIGEMHPVQFFQTAEQEQVRQRIEAVFTEGQAEVEASLLGKDGSMTPFYFTGVRVEIGGRPHVAGVGIETARLKRTQEELSRSLAEFRALHEAGGRMSAALSLSGVVDAAIEAARKATGADHAVFFLKTPQGLEIRGAGPAPFACPESSSGPVGEGGCLCGLAAAEKSPVYRSPLDGAARTAKSSCGPGGIQSFASLPLVSEGEVLGVLGLGSRTDRGFAAQSLFLEALAATASVSVKNALLYEKVENNVRQLERQAREREKAEATMRLQSAALGAAANAIMITDREGVIQWVNPAWCQMTGFGEEETRGRTPRILKSGVQGPEFYRTFWRRALAGEVIDGDVVNRRKDGSLYHEHETITPVTDARGAITHFIAIKEDVTDRRRTESRIRQLSRIYSVLSEINQLIVRERVPRRVLAGACEIAVEKGGFRLAWVGLTGPGGASLKVAAHAGATVPGLAMLERIARSPRESCPYTSLALTSKRHAVCPDIGTSPADPSFRAETLELGFHSMISLPLLPGGSCAGVFNLYSSEPDAFDEAELDLLDEMAADISFALDLADRDRQREDAELRAEKLAAFPEKNPNPVLEFSPTGVLTYANPAVESLVQKTGAGSVGELLPKDAAEIARSCLETLQPRLRLETRHGPSTISWSFYPIAEANAVHCYAHDITERLELEEQLRQSQKMDAIGHLAGGIAHDFNNLLTVIEGNASLLQTDRLPLEGRAASLDEIRQACERASNLTRQLLAFSRRQKLQPRLIDLNDAITSMMRMLRRILGENVRVQLDLDPRPLLTVADRGMIDQVLLNLAVNARDAMPSGGVLALETGEFDIPPEGSSRHPEARPGPHVLLRVKDTGTGIPAGILPHIFEPFFTTKGPGKGTGLGLATVFGIVKQHEGSIRAASEPGSGAAFEIVLPAAPAGSIQKEDETPAAVRGRGERILLVEDEDSVREIVERILTAHGYRVAAVGSGPAGLAAWDGTNGAFDLVLTDMVMPGGLSGQEFAALLRSRAPGVRIVFMSGYSGEEPRDARGSPGLDGLLRKPFATAALLRHVRSGLDRAGEP